MPVQSIRAARILQDYVVTLAINGEPSTIVTNPFPIPKPEPYYQHSYDGKVQRFDTGFNNFPLVRRGDTESEDVCREWQRMSST